MRLRCSASVFAVAAILAAGAPAAAQTATPPPVAGSAEEQALGAEARGSIIGGEVPNAIGNTDIVVTGSRLVRPNNRSAAPITSVTAAQIQAQGAVNIEEVMNNLPQVQANQEQNFSDSEGRQRIKLRNLGFERTLLLVDGLRLNLNTAGLDVGILPVALIERIDVLSGGASSVYGSDAVSGVVNYVLRKNFEGIRIDANYSFFNHNNRENPVSEAARRANFRVPLGMTNDGGRVNVTLSAGANFLEDRVNLSSFINYRSGELIEYGDRSHSACMVTQPLRDGPLACSLATFTAAGTIIPQSGPRAGQFLVNDPTGARRFVGLNTGPGTTANPFDAQSFQRSFERVNVGGFLTAEVSDEIEFHSTALYYRDTSSNNLLPQTFNFTAFGSEPYRINCNNPFLSASQARDLCGDAAGTSATAPVDVRYRFDGEDGRQNRFLNQGYRVTSGLRGQGFDGIWSYDLSGMFARNQGTSQGAPVPAFDRVQRSLQVENVNGVPTCRSVINGQDPACVPFNAFTPFLNDPALFDYLLTRTGATTSGISRLTQIVGSVSGDLGRYGVTSPLAEEGVTIAIASEFRSELFRQTANDIFRQISGGQDQRFTQNVIEANVEVSAPLVEDRPWTHLLELAGGYRISKYNRLSGTFDTWKMEGLWAPIEDITFRGSYNKAQRAPNVIEAAQAADVIFDQGFFADPCASRLDPANPNGPRLAPIARIEQCRNTGLPDNLYGSPTLICPDERCTVRNGGFNLTPETAFTTTFGAVLRPRFLPGLTVSVDRFLISLRDSIGFYQASDWINGCLTTGLEFFCRGISRNPGTFTLSSPPAGDPATGWVARGTANGFRQRSNGWDFQGQYNLPLASAGRLDFSFNGTLMTSTGAQDSPAQARRECVGFFGPPGCNESLPRWMHNLFTTWTSPDQAVNISVNWRHRSPLTLAFNAPPETGIPVTPADRRETFARVPSYDWFDLAISFNIERRYTLRIAANNIFDRNPPLLPDSRNVLGLLRNNTIMGYDMLGRNIVVGVGMNF